MTTGACPYFKDFLGVGSRLFTCSQKNNLFAFLVGVTLSWTRGAFGREKGILVRACSSQLTGCSFHFSYGC